MPLKPLTFAAALGGLCLMSTGGLAAEAGGGAALATAAALRDKALTDSTAYDFLSDLTTEIGSRRAGSSAEHRAAQSKASPFPAGLAARKRPSWSVKTPSVW